MTSGPWTLRSRASDRHAEHLFLATVSALFAMSTTVTIVWSSDMSAMPAMPMAGGWTMSMAWMGMPGQTWGAAAASWLGMWIVMMAAMMLPPLVSMLCQYRETVAGASEGRLGLLTLTVGAAYFAVWAVIGMGVYPLGSALAVAVMDFETLSRVAPIARGGIVLIAGAIQFSPWKVRHLACCRQSFEPHASLPADLGTAWRHGVRLGLHCSASSVGLTAILLVLGVMDLRVMALVTAAITTERLAPAGERIARIIGFLVIGVGVGLLARTGDLL